MQQIASIQKGFIEAVESYFHAQMTGYEELGSGANGHVFNCSLDKEPYQVALKIAPNSQLLLQEAKELDFLAKHVDKGFAKVFFTVAQAEGEAAVCMELFDGVSAESVRSQLRIMRARKIFAEGAIDALLRLHAVTNTQFGPIGDAKYDTWDAYYKPFAASVLQFAQEKKQAGGLAENVLAVMQQAFSLYDRIFDEPVEEAALTHGDFWTPNLILNPETMAFLGAVDPFEVMWADPEYDLFAMLAGKGNQYHLLDTYKAKVQTSRKIDVKLEFYALFNEIHWYSITDHVFQKFIDMKAKKLQKEMKKAGLLG